MIIGRMQNLHAMVPVTFRLAGKPDLTIEFVADTGFTGFLTLPPQAIAAMGLNYLTDYPSQLADGSIIAVPTFEAAIPWDGGDLDVRILATGNRPLLGTVLLSGKEFLAQFVDQGIVTVDNV